MDFFDFIFTLLILLINSVRISIIHIILGLFNLIKYEINNNIKFYNNIIEN